jgi:poly(A) polymerase
MRKFAPNFEIIMADLLKTEQQFKDAVLDNRVANEREPLMELLMKKAQDMGLAMVENLNRE